MTAEKVFIFTKKLNLGNIETIPFDIDNPLF